MAKKEKPDEGMDATVRIALDDTAVAERGRALAEKLGVVKTLRDQKRADAERIQTQIDGLLDEAEELRLEILEGAAEKRQGDLWASDVVAGSPDALPPAAATGALAEVAKRAGEPPFDFAGDEQPEAPVQVTHELAGAKRGKREKGASA